MNNDHICGFLLGLSVGGGLALLLAPRPGSKTRAQIAQAAADGVTYAKETVRDTARGFVERGKEEVARHADDIAKAMKRGEEAYQQAVR